MGLRKIPVANIVSLSVPPFPLPNGEESQLCTLQKKKVSCPFPPLAFSSQPLVNLVLVHVCYDPTAMDYWSNHILGIQLVYLLRASSIASAGTSLFPVYRSRHLWGYIGACSASFLIEHEA